MFFVILNIALWGQPLLFNLVICIKENGTTIRNSAIISTLSASKDNFDKMQIIALPGVND
jgi:hypothetical protein